MSVPTVPGIGAGRSPIHQLIALLFEAERDAVSGVDGELERMSARLAEGLITIGAEPWFDIEAYNVAPEAIRTEQNNALGYLGFPAETYAEAWTRGAYALSSIEDPGTSCSVLDRLYDAHPMYEPIVTALRALEADEAYKAA